MEQNNKCETFVKVQWKSHKVLHMSALYVQIAGNLLI